MVFVRPVLTNAQPINIYYMNVMFTSQPFYERVVVSIGLVAAVALLHSAL